MKNPLMFFLIASSLLPTLGVGRDLGETSHWGLTVEGGPWTTPSGLAKSLGGHTALPAFQGSEVSVGITHGKSHGGDWGIEFVDKRFSAFSVDQRNVFCQSPGSCVTGGYLFASKDTSVLGGEIHKYVHFVNIGGHFQIGMNFAGGVGKLMGTITKQDFRTISTFTMDQSGFITGVVFTQGPTVTTSQSSQSYVQQSTGLSVFPLLKTQVVVAAEITPHLKLKVSSGLNLPGIQWVGGSLTYFFGGGR